MRLGDRVYWTRKQYYFNNSRPTETPKYGIYRGLVKHRKGYMGFQMGLVKVEGNMNLSKVPVRELLTKGDPQE